MAKLMVPKYQVHDFVLKGAERGNPFLVEVAARFTHESGEVLAGVPGFYNGDGEWVIRFSPGRIGVWRGITSSAVVELNGVELGPLNCVENTNPAVHGRLVIDSRHPHRFRFEDGAQAIPLGFEWDWMFAQHQEKPEEFRQMIDLLAARGFNYIVTNVYAHSGFSDPNLEWVYSPPQRFVFGGSNEAPDHSRLNMDFFKDYDAALAYAHSKGMLVHLMIQVQNKKVNWPARKSAEDDLYWRYVVARYQAYSNIVWDVSKECFYLLTPAGECDYILDRIRLIRQTDGYRHLVTAHDTALHSEAQDSPADGACDFVSDQIHLRDIALYNHEAIRRFRAGRKPYLNIEYGYERGVEALPTYKIAQSWQELLLWTWALYLGGAYPCYYYSNTSWDLVKYRPEAPGWARYRYLMDFLSRLNFNVLTPDNEFVEQGYCMAEAGKQYLIFLPDGGDALVDLTAVLAGTALECEWLDIYSGERQTAPLEERSFRVELKNPFADPSQPCAIAIRAGAVGEGRG